MEPTKRMQICNFVDSLFGKMPAMVPQERRSVLFAIELLSLSFLKELAGVETFEESETFKEAYKKLAMLGIDVSELPSPVVLQ